jgi:hypothetical protein
MAKHYTDSKMSLKGLIEFYGRLLKTGVILRGGAGHQRMRDLEHKAQQRYDTRNAVKSYIKWKIGDLQNPYK